MEVEATIPAIAIVIVAEIISAEMTGTITDQVTDETIETVTGIEVAETTEIIGIIAHNPQVEDSIKVEAIIK